MHCDVDRPRRPEGGSDPREEDIALDGPDPAAGMRFSHLFQASLVLGCSRILGWDCPVGDIGTGEPLWIPSCCSASVQ